MLRELIRTAKSGYTDGLAKGDKRIQKKHMRRAMRRHHGPTGIIMTTCMRPELDALLADGWDLVFTRSVAIGSPRFDLLRSLDKA